jgi:hypothetical protein
MRLKILLAAALLAGASPAVWAHAPKMGANGGPQADAGSFHVEVVPEGNTVQVFLRDHGDKAVQTAGFKGVAIFTIDGKAQRIPLAPAGDNKLSGSATMPIPAAPKGAVQIITPTGSTVQAKFN